MCIFFISNSNIICQNKSLHLVDLLNHLLQVLDILPGWMNLACSLHLSILLMSEFGLSIHTQNFIFDITFELLILQICGLKIKFLYDLE